LSNLIFSRASVSCSEPRYTRTRFKIYVISKAFFYQNIPGRSSRRRSEDNGLTFRANSFSGAHRKAMATAPYRQKMNKAAIPAAQQ
jgi:hypothetical protein